VSKKILIAEDSLTMRSLIVSTIAAMGDYDTVEAANGFEALRILPREKVDIELQDHRHQAEDGRHRGQQHRPQALGAGPQDGLAVA